jgi:UDP-N-acetylmuramoylalanine--D-glutamate ligase
MSLPLYDALRRSGLTPPGVAPLSVLVIGAGREGLALARFFASLGVRITVADMRSAEALAKGPAADRLAALEAVCDAHSETVELALGQASPALEGVDLLFLSPGVPPTAPVVQEARQRRIPISSEPRLFTRLCPAPIIGITGSSGKTTTTTLVGEMQRAAGDSIADSIRDSIARVWVGGNLGYPLLERLVDEDRAPDAVAMELSSFQLELFDPAYQGEGCTTSDTNPADDRQRAIAMLAPTAGWSPHIAAVTNITPNHLDRHRSMAEYRRAKSQILRYQGADDWAVLNRDNPDGWSLRDLVRGHLLAFSLREAVEVGAFLRGDTLMVRDGQRERALCARAELTLRGEHNIANVLTAACCGLASGLDLAPMRHAAITFAGVPHRLEPVRRWREALFVNDSIATSPERAIAALRAFEEPVVLLAGGRDKHLPWAEWAEVVGERARVVIAFGEAAPIIEAALQTAETQRPALHRADTLDDAVALATSLARPGDVVLLSPGGTSFDAFQDFEERGQRFRDLVGAL